MKTYKNASYEYNFIRFRVTIVVHFIEKRNLNSKIDIHNKVPAFCWSRAKITKQSIIKCCYEVQIFKKGPWNLYWENLVMIIDEVRERDLYTKSLKVLKLVWGCIRNLNYQVVPRVNDLNHIEKLLFYSELPCLECSLLVFYFVTKFTSFLCLYIYFRFGIYYDWD